MSKRELLRRIKRAAPKEEPQHDNPRLPSVQATQAGASDDRGEAAITQVEQTALLLPAVQSQAVGDAGEGVSMTTVRNPRDGVLYLVERCRSCNASIYWGTTAAGKKCPYNVTDEL